LDAVILNKKILIRKNSNSVKALIPMKGDLNSISKSGVITKSVISPKLIYIAIGKYFFSDFLFEK
jgi:hypothetical protein